MYCIIKLFAYICIVKQPKNNTIMKASKSNTTSQFYVKATASWKDSSRRKGGYFNYSDVVKNNCLIEVKGNVATIYADAIAAGYVITDTKLITGKYFEFKGKEVKEATFKKHLADRFNESTSLKEAYQAKIAIENQEKQDRINAEKAAIKAEFDMIKFDDKFFEDKKLASTNSQLIGAFKALLSRNNIERLQYFYQVLKLV